MPGTFKPQLTHQALRRPWLDGPAEGLVAKLLGRDQQDAHVPELNLLQHLRPLGHGQEAIEGGGALDVAGQQTIDLVLHQGLQRRDDHRETAIAMKTVQGRKLVAQRFAPFRRENGQHVLALHARQHHVVLQGTAVRLGTKVVEAEVTLELVTWVMGGAAVATVRLPAGRVAQLGDQLTDFWKLVTDPRGQDRVAARDAQPGQGIGQWPVQGLVQQVDFEQLLQAGAADLEGTGKGRFL